MYVDVHCPACGPFLAVVKRIPKQCPECENEQAIVLEHDHMIDERFRQERESLERD